jgi:hypothetical protein
MRTKTLLAAAAVIAAGMASSMAQAVYSQNVVGYVNVACAGAPGGKYTMIANPLNTTNNTLEGVLNNANIPVPCNFYRWNGTGYDIATYFGTWDNNYSLAPGQGGFVLSESPFTNTFVGEVLQGSLTNSFTSGFSLVSSKVPQGATTDVLGLDSALSAADTLYKWDVVNQSYIIYTYFGSPGSWDSQPSIAVGESFFLVTGGPGNWVRNFTVN